MQINQKEIIKISHIPSDADGWYLVEAISDGDVVVDVSLEDYSSELKTMVESSQAAAP